LQFWSGRDRPAPELAVWVQRGKLQFSAWSRGPAEKEKEEKAGQLTENLTTLTWQAGKKQFSLDKQMVFGASAEFYIKVKNPFEG
jgi:hypothetical protein